jgi:hypothetical protein
MNYFDMTQYLEPKCQNCGSRLDYGVTTKFSESVGSHVCISCGQVI